jgi:2-polyprenyl-3-methyl-5-hydroxy-6-metoxy-1,4-benzoquinol methylase
MSQNTVRKKPRLNRKFRFQLLKDWLVLHYRKCRVADIGGGKGLLAYLLLADGWEATVIEPNTTSELKKYREVKSKKRVKLKQEDWSKLTRIESELNPNMVDKFDVLVCLHAHGVNIEVIRICTHMKKDFVLLPCCVIDEPIIKKSKINWFASLVDYAKELGLDPKIDQLNFKGKNRIIYTDNYFGKYEIK